MLGCRSGFQALIKTVAPNAIGTHCVINRQVLAAKTLPSDLKQIMSLVIQAVNFIKSSALVQEFSPSCALKRTPNQHNCCFKQRSDGCPRAKS
jgi:hypothetical protein